MSDDFTTQDLINKRAITNARGNAAVDAYTANPNAEPIALRNDYRLALDGAVMAHPYAQQVVRLPDASEALKRAALCRAILIARPVKGWIDL